MYPKKNRLTQTEDFLRVKRGGRFFKSPFFNILYLEDQNFNNLKLGFIVSNAVGKAVVRNRIKRKLRGLFGFLLKTEKKGYILIIGKNKAYLAKSEEMNIYIEKAKKFYEF